MTRENDYEEAITKMVESEEMYNKLKERNAWIKERYVSALRDNLVTVKFLMDKVGSTIDEKETDGKNVSDEEILDLMELDRITYKFCSDIIKIQSLKSKKN